jgi:hypothetical protein
MVKRGNAPRAKVCGRTLAPLWLTAGSMLATQGTDLPSTDEMILSPRPSELPKSGSH